MKERFSRCFQWIFMRKIFLYLTKTTNNKKTSRAEWNWRKHVTFTLLWCHKSFTKKFAVSKSKHLVLAYDVLLYYDWRFMLNAFRISKASECLWIRGIESWKSFYNFSSYISCAVLRCCVIWNKVEQTTEDKTYFQYVQNFWNASHSFEEKTMKNSICGIRK